MHSALLQLAVHHHRFHGPHLDYLGVGVGAFISWCGVSGPGEAALIAAGILAAKGRLDIASVITVAWVGANAGGVVGWLAGRHGGRAVLTAKGPLRRTRMRILRSGDRFYDRYAVLAVYFAPSWMAGINGMHSSRFIPINAVACLVWAMLVGLGAYFAGPRVEDLLSGIGTVGLAALVVVGAGAWLFERRRRRRRKLAG